MVQPWLEEQEMQAVECGPVESWFPQEDVKPFPYHKTFDEAEWEPLCVLHTSGSTGNPKPIVIRQGMVAISDRYHTIPDWEGRRIFLRGFSDDSERNFLPSE
jgi:acyl-coenzyme A synthetase/AMP-(fatty) acid ligase